jgi:hypothetical protein
MDAKLWPLLSDPFGPNAAVLARGKFPLRHSGDR